MDIIEETVEKIKKLQIQGATNIVKASLAALKTWSKQTKGWTLSDFNKNAKSLATARPTEPFVQNIISSIVQTIELSGIENAVKNIEDMENKLIEVKDKIIENGIKTLKGKKIILTHCHSSNVEDILKRLYKLDNTIKVFTTKTEPLHQGEITAKNLASAGIKVTMITDSEAAFMISKEDKQRINAVLIGADAILKDGSIINKVGSYGIALSAHNAKIPLYVVASLLKFTPKKIKIEERSGGEIWDNPPEGVLLFNPAFDKVPKEFITGIITEDGTLKPNNVEDEVKKLYPWILL